MAKLGCNGSSSLPGVCGLLGAHTHTYENDANPAFQFTIRSPTNENGRSTGAHTQNDDDSNHDGRGMSAAYMIAGSDHLPNRVHGWLMSGAEVSRDPRFHCDLSLPGETSRSVSISPKGINPTPLKYLN